MPGKQISPAELRATKVEKSSTVFHFSKARTINDVCKMWVNEGSDLDERTVEIEGIYHKIRKLGGVWHVAYNYSAPA